MLLLSVTEGAGYEQTVRSRPGHPGPVDPENRRARTAERVGDRPALETSLGRRSPGQRRVAVSGAAQAGAGGVDHRGVEAEREQPPREVLLAHAARPPASREGNRQLEPPVGGDLRRREAEGGMTHALRALVLHRAASPALAVPPRPCRAGARRRVARACRPTS